VMVEPPGDFGRAGILEIHDGVFVTIEVVFVKKRAGAMQQAGEHELDIVADPFPVKAREERSG